MPGSPLKSKSNEPSDNILSGSVRTASYNIVFQILARIFTFLLNAFILRFVGHDILGICNVRLALLYSSILFLSREPFRRACLRKSEKESWEQTINLTWLAFPANVIWALVLGYVWCYHLPQPRSELLGQYQQSVWLISLSTIFDSLSETPYIIGQYFQLSKLRIIGDTTLIIVRSLFLCAAVIYFPNYAIVAYASGTVFGSSIVGLIYFGFFYYEILIRNDPGRSLPFSSFFELLPNWKNFQVPAELKMLVQNFFKQGILKQILTEGERYMMTFFDILSFEEQGIYDLVSNLGSLAARFIFLPIEESAYLFFAQSLQKRNAFTRHRKEEPKQAANVLGNLFRMMLMIGLILIAYGIPFSNTVLYLYGGQNLSENSTATHLLQANCAYILFIALNGITEAFTFAVMTQEQLDKFNKKLVIFSGIFLFCAFVFTRLFGGIGFFLANSLNMILRIGQSVYLIRHVFSGCDLEPFKEWVLHKLIFVAFTFAFIINSFMVSFEIGRLMSVSIGLIIFAANCSIIILKDKKLLTFFLDIYKEKKN